MRSHRLHPLFPLSLFLGLHTAGMTQTLPDAGSIRQQIEQQRMLPLPPAAAPERVAPPPEIKPRAGLSVTVKTFRFAGNTLITSEQLAPAVSSFLNRPIGFAELQSAADAVAATFREAGWIVRVYLPEQDISAGVVTLQVIEARFGGTRFEGLATSHVVRSEIEAYFSEQPKTGQPLAVAAVDRALLLADDLPGVSVAGTLVPGPADGETALVLQATDEPLFYGDISLDNMGARATGSDRLTANLNFNSPGGRGELVSLNLLHTQGSDYGRVAMTVPDGYNGLRLGVSVSALNYQVVNGPAANTTAQIKGRSGSLGMDLSYPVVRARLHNLYLSSGLETKSFYTQDSQVRSDYESNSLRVGLSGNRFDSLGGGGANSASMQVLWGRLTSLQTYTQLNTPTAYNKLSYSLSRQQTLTAGHSLLVNLSGQHATQVLDSSEKFYIGGAQSVRAYPSSEIGGERGQVLTGEWRWRFNPAWVATAFADVGRVVSLPPTASEQYTASQLRGLGASLSWQSPQGVVTKMTVARRSGNNPKPTLAGTDGDGTLKLNRVWLSASLPF